MSTRSTTHFFSSKHDEEPEAIVYRHWDGYPEGAGRDLTDFVERVREFQDSRFSDASYLAARYVAYLGEMFRDPNGDSLDFISVGICRQDPTDIEYRYLVICDGTPTIEAYEVSCSYPDNVWSKTPVEIPA